MLPAPGAEYVEFVAYVPARAGTGGGIEYRRRSEIADQVADQATGKVAGIATVSPRSGRGPVEEAREPGNGRPEAPKSSDWRLKAGWTSEGMCWRLGYR